MPKNVIYCLLLFFALSSDVFARPLIGIAGIDINSPRGLNVSIMIEQDIQNLATLAGSFDILNYSLLKEQLQKFSCTDESCLASFAGRAKISILIRGDIDDRGDFIILKLKAFGYAPPYNGMEIHSYSARIRMRGGYTQNEFGFISEEHATRFIAGLYKKFLWQEKISKDQSGYFIPTVKNISGKMDLYREENGEQPLKRYSKAGTVTVENNRITGSDFKLIGSEFAYISFSDKSDFLEDYFYGRKREVVFKKSGLEDTLLSVLFTVPASISMPLSAPWLGYYANSDWAGLALWGINATPYIYLEARGLLNNPDELKKSKKDISRSCKTDYYFGLYMAFSGGTALFVDAFANRYLSDASEYSSPQPLMGNSLTAGYLSLVSGGGGHFYRGNRFWGYLYFHANNILLYCTIREFSSGEKYNQLTGRYEKESINRKRAYLYAGSYALLKAVEITHAVLSRDRIMNGDVSENTDFSVEPVAYIGTDSELILGMKFGVAF